MLFALSLRSAPAIPAKYSVFLSHDERQRLDDLTRTGTRHARAIQHARILLLADEDDGHGPAWTDEKIADALGCGTATVARIRRRFARDGFDEALRVRKAVPGRPLKIDGVAEAHLVALACSEPPTGRARWTGRLLADRFAELGVEEGFLDGPVSRETVRLTLKKNKLKPHRVKHKEISIGVIPPKKSAAFVADMERVLALYAEAYDEKRPVVCLDERPCALAGKGASLCRCVPARRSARTTSTRAAASAAS